LYSTVPVPLLTVVILPQGS